MKKNRKNSYNKGYQAAIQLLFYEGQIAWQMNILFIALNIGIGTIIQNKLSEFDKIDFVLIFMTSAGIVINILWLGSFRRNNKYYHFRMAQAREAEDENWKLLKERGYKFSKGDEIIITGNNIDLQDLKHKLGGFEKFASNKKAIGVSIWIFIIAFSLLFLASLKPVICIINNSILCSKHYS